MKWRLRRMEGGCLAGGKAWAPDDSITRFLNCLVDHSPSTIELYGFYLRKFEGELPVPLDLATFDEICAALQATSKRYSGTAFATIKSAVRGFLAYTGREDLAKRIPNRRPRWLPKRGPTAEEIDRFFAVADFRERAITMILYSTGMRIGELVGNRKSSIPPAMAENVDWENGTIRFTGKGGNEECAAFFIRRTGAMNILKLWLNGRTSGPIFTITESSVDRRFGILSRLAGIKVTPHLLRHSTCYSMRKGGADFMDRKMQLRHNCTESTIAYERAEPQALIELAKEREWR